jgi:hypothetical protein
MTAPIRGHSQQARMPRGQAAPEFSAIECEYWNPSVFSPYRVIRRVENPVPRV